MLQSLDRRVCLNLVNAVLFQLGWFAAVLGGDKIAVLVTALVLLIHALLLRPSRNEWWFIGGVGLVGAAWDSMIVLSGFFQFQQSSVGLIPLWLLCVWLLFATTINHSLRWLEERTLLAILFGAFGGSTSYLAGSRLAAVELAQPLWFTLTLLALCWAVILPLLLRLGRAAEC